MNILETQPTPHHGQYCLYVLKGTPHEKRMFSFGHWLVLAGFGYIWYGCKAEFKTMVYVCRNCVVPPPPGISGALTNGGG